MSKARNERRKRQRDASKHTNVLAVHLSEFYEFLSSSPKPSDEAVRETFIRHRNAWHNYCASHKLTESAKDLGDYIQLYTIYIKQKPDND